MDRSQSQSFGGQRNIEDDVLEEVAKALGVPADSIKNFDEQKMHVYVQNIYDSAHGTSNTGPYYQCTINPIDKLFELSDKNEKLYEQLLKVEREKIALLEKMLAEKK